MENKEIPATEQIAVTIEYNGKSYTATRYFCGGREAFIDWEGVIQVAGRECAELCTKKALQDEKNAQIVAAMDPYWIAPTFINSQPTSTTLYLYPDGTRSTKAPLDKEIFYYTPPGSHGMVTPSVWQWDEQKQQWFDVTFYGSSPDKRYPLVSPNTSIKCECGSDSVGSPRHSQWCPKHDKT